MFLNIIAALAAFAITTHHYLNAVNLSEMYGLTSTNPLLKHSYNASIGMLLYGAAAGFTYTAINALTELSWVTFTAGLSAATVYMFNESLKYEKTGTVFTLMYWYMHVTGWRGVFSFIVSAVFAQISCFENKRLHCIAVAVSTILIYAGPQHHTMMWNVLHYIIQCITAVTTGYFTFMHTIIFLLANGVPRYMSILCGGISFCLAAVSTMYSLSFVTYFITSYPVYIAIAGAVAYISVRLYDLYIYAWLPKRWQTTAVSYIASLVVGLIMYISIVCSWLWPYPSCILLLTAVYTWMISLNTVSLKDRNVPLPVKISSVGILYITLLCLLLLVRTCPWCLAPVPMLKYFLKTSKRHSVNKKNSQNTNPSLLELQNHYHFHRNEWKMTSCGFREGLDVTPLVPNGYETLWHDTMEGFYRHILNTEYYLGLEPPQ